jgi:hypothetical protein
MYQPLTTARTQVHEIQHKQETFPNVHDLNPQQERIRTRNFCTARAPAEYSQFKLTQRKEGFIPFINLKAACLWPAGIQ